MILSDILIWSMYGILALYTAPAIYFDLKDREMPKDFWKPLYGIALPTTAYLYLTGDYAIEALPVGLFLVAIAFIIQRDGRIFQGADFMFLSAIFLFLIKSPRGVPIAAFPFLLYLVGAIVCVGGTMLALEQWLEKDVSSYDLPDVRKFVHAFRQEPPFMVHISLALICTLVFA